MGTEVNLGAILALEKRIEGGTEDLIKLKRARNSLLNISTIIPPEILAHIFLLNVIPNGKFRGLQNGSYNFLLVCHYWYEVASKASGIWVFWGSNLHQWSQRYQRSVVTAPLDLVLSSYRDVYSPPFDGPLQDALRIRVASNSIRSIHLSNWDTALLDSIISSLTPVGGGIWHSNIESLILDSAEFDASDFVARHHFPKLQHLSLRARTSSPTWDHLASHTTTLTCLTLMGGSRSATPNTSQLLSILASNPQLQTLCLTAIPHDGGDGSNFLVPLRCLQRLRVDGDFPSVLRLLHRLDYPTTMVSMYLSLSDCTEEDISGTVGPCMRDHILRDGRFQDRLGIFVSASCCSISIHAIVVDDANGPTISPTDRCSTLMFYLVLKEDFTPDEIGSIFIDFAAHLPREHVILFKGNMYPNATKEIAAMMPNIQELQLVETQLSDGFLQPDPTGSTVGTKLLPSLRYLHLESTQGRKWSSLVHYLIHQTSGGQVVSLRIAESSGHICSPMVETIKNLVQELVLEFDYIEHCPFDICQGDGEQDDGEDDDSGGEVL